MPVLLGARSSDLPLPAGRPTRKAVGSAGQIAFPPAGNWIDSGGGSSQLGPFNLPYRYWLCAIANNILISTQDWVRYDLVLRLIVNGAYGADLNGQLLHQNAESSVNNVWNGQTLEAKFYCEANTRYDVQLLTYITPSGPVYYYQSPGHQNMYAYTIGEGVY